MSKAPRCACGCGLPTGGGEFYPGHNTFVGRHWSASRAESKRTSFLIISKRQQRANALFARGEVSREYSAEYFELYRRVKAVRQDAEMEYVVATTDGWCAIDVCIPVLKLGFEHDPGHRYATATVAESDRDLALVKSGWRLVHCKTVPSLVLVGRAIRERESSLKERS